MPVASSRIEFGILRKLRRCPLWFRLEKGRGTIEGCMRNGGSRESGLSARWLMVRLAVKVEENWRGWHGCWLIVVLAGNISSPEYEQWHRSLACISLRVGFNIIVTSRDRALIAKLVFAQCKLDKLLEQEVWKCSLSAWYSKPRIFSLLRWFWLSMLWGYVCL